MRSMIEELYNWFPDVNNCNTPERKEISEEYFKLCRQVEDAFGLDFMDRLAKLKEQRLGYQGKDHFAAGFRLGVRLMLEVFTPV